MAKAKSRTRVRSFLKSASVALTVSALLFGAERAEAQYYSQYYSFGDSLSDNGRILREFGVDPSAAVLVALGVPGIWSAGLASNAPNWTQVLPGLIGTPTVARNGYAVGGAIAIDQLHLAVPGFSYGVVNQISDFAARTGTFGSRDLVSLWIGYNDITQGATAATVVERNLARAKDLVSLGARNLLILGQHTSRPTIPSFANNNAEAAIARQVNAALPSALQPLAANGVNVHYFDVEQLMQKLRADPVRYGFRADAATVYCVFVASCARSGSTTGEADQFIYPEGIHLSGRANTILASYIANQLNAPLTVAPQAEMARAGSEAITGSLMSRLDAYHNLQGAVVMADLGMPAKAPPRGEPMSPLSLFVLGTYARSNQSVNFGLPSSMGAGSDLGAGTVGFDYRLNRNVLLGAAYSYSDTSADTAVGNARTGLKAHQFAGFAAINYGAWFNHLVVSYGLSEYNIRRDGYDTQLRASTDGNTFTAAWRTGYLFDAGMLRLGPIGGVNYSKVWIDGYTETGDSLLTQSVAKQTADGWTGDIGVQLRLPTGYAPYGLNPFVNLTAQHEFGRAARVLTTAMTSAPMLPIATEIGDGRSQTYGKVAIGAAVDLGGRWSATLTTETTFSRRRGDLAAVTGGLTARW